METDIIDQKHSVPFYFLSMVPVSFLTSLTPLLEYFKYNNIRLSEKRKLRVLEFLFLLFLGCG